MIALFVYDHLLCMSREMQLMWQPTLRFSTMLYMMTRYLLYGLLLTQNIIPESLHRVKYLHNA